MGWSWRKHHFHSVYSSGRLNGPHVGRLSATPSSARASDVRSTRHCTHALHVPTGETHALHTSTYQPPDRQRPPRCMAFCQSYHGGSESHDKLQVTRTVVGSRISFRSCKDLVTPVPWIRLRWLLMYQARLLVYLLDVRVGAPIRACSRNSNPAAAAQTKGRCHCRYSDSIHH